MDTNIDQLQDHLIDIFAGYDQGKTGKIQLLQVQDALRRSKKVSLTPFQINSLLGLSEPDKDGLVEYKSFSLKCKEMINELFSMKAMVEKSTLISQGIFKPPENLEETNLSGLDLFKIFKKYDRNMNGFLEIYEYIQCLKESDVKLTEAEIITLGLQADINGDGRIDYEEFMKHFQDCLRLMRYQSTLQEAYNLYSQQYKISSNPALQKAGTLRAPVKQN